MKFFFLSLGVVCVLQVGAFSFGRTSCCKALPRGLLANEYCWTRQDLSLMILFAAYSPYRRAFAGSVRNMAQQGWHRDHQRCAVFEFEMHGYEVALNADVLISELAT